MLFDKTSEGLTVAVHYAGLRHKIIANNIANLDTPGYKALDISFGEQLEDFMGREGSKAQRIRNNASFIAHRQSSSYTSRSMFRPASLPPPTLRLTPDLSSLRPRMDGNTVSVDQEQVKLSQNAIFHNTCLQLLRSKFRILKLAISGNV